MNKIQRAMKDKAQEAMGEVEHQVDLFFDNNYKTKFSMLKYLEQLKYKRKIVNLMRAELDYPLGEALSDDEQLIEGYSFMTAKQKQKYIEFLQTMQADCDKYIDKHANEWLQDSRRRRNQKAMRKRHAERLAEIEQGTGYKRKKRK
tara:strand:+ start:2325 stop:2762 length:438 start_codon:yes stop_codon:yes gene_type:complete